YLAAGGNTFLEFKDNIQEYIAATTVNYNQGNPGYRPLELANLTHAVNQQTNAVTTAMTANLKQFQATPPPPPLKLLRKLVLLAEVLIHITSILPPVTKLS
nr:hypothetical protein [Tanacetum cinerariifolium]